MNQLVSTNKEKHCVQYLLSSEVLSDIQASMAWSMMMHFFDGANQLSSLLRGFESTNWCKDVVEHHARIRMLHAWLVADSVRYVIMVRYELHVEANSVVARRGMFLLRRYQQWREMCASNMNVLYILYMSNVLTCDNTYLCVRTELQIHVQKLILPLFLFFTESWIYLFHL